VRAEALTTINVFTEWLAAWRQTSQSEHPQLVSRGRTLALGRRAALKTLMALDPKAALERAVPRSLRGELPAEVVAELETPVDAFGRFEVIAVCFGDKDKVERFANINGQRFVAYTYGRRLSALSKSRLAIHGFTIDDRLALAEEPYRRLEPAEPRAQGEPANALPVAVGDSTKIFSSDAELAAWSARVGATEDTPGPDALEADMAAGADTASWVFGEKTTLWLRAEFPDDLGSPATDQAISDSMATVNSYYADVSRSRTSFKTTIFPGTLLTSSTKATVQAQSDTGQYLVSDDVLQQARNYDAAHGNTGLYNPDKYDRWIVLFKNVPELGVLQNGAIIHWSGLGRVGNKGLWLNGSSYAGTVIHELGHNQGLWHSHAWQPSSSSPIAPGTHVEYGDAFDVMGFASNIPCGYFNTKQKFNIFYLDPAESLSVSTGGIYRIYRHDSRSASGVQALNIAAGTAYDYWLEYRQQDQPQYQSFPDRLRNGVTVRWGKSPSFTSGLGTYLLDATPNTSFGMRDSPVGLGETFTDPDYGINITPIATGGAEPNQWIDIRVYFGAAGSNHNPTVTAAPPAGSLSARTDINFTATGSDPDGDALYYRWDFGDGLSNPTTATVTHRWLKGGTYPISVTALDGKGGLATTTLNVSVGDPLLTWIRRANGLTTNSFYDVIYAGGQFVGGGAGGLAAISPDGVTWTLATRIGSNVVSQGVAYGSGRYVAVGKDYNFASSTWMGCAAYSSDGLTWQLCSLPAGAPELKKVAYGANRFVAVGTGGKIYSSANGITWTETTSGVTDDLFAIRFADGVFVAAGSNGRILPSADGLTWMNKTPATSTAHFSGVARYNGTWYVSTGYETWTSPDALTWAKAPAPTGFPFANSLTVGLGVLFGPSYNGNIFFTQDATTWASTMPSASRNDSFYAAAEGNGTVVVVGSNGVIYDAVARPVISSALTASGQVGVAYSYAIIASNAPTTFNATGLPAGLSVNTATGIISGAPTASGNYSINIAAANAYGTDTRTLNLALTIPPPPLITANLTASAKLGFGLNFTISASNTPTSYNATGLPPGMSINQSTGQISGASTATGTYLVQLAAANYGGTATSTLTLTIARAPQDSLLSGTQSDLLLENNATGERVIWQMRGAAIVASENLPTFTASWHFVGVGDFNNDGRADIVLQNTLSGERVIWLMNGATISGSLGLPTLPLAWQFACVGDINNDGKPDIILQNTATNDRIIWLMNGNTITSSVALPSLPRAWQICGILDFTGDGQPDLLIQNTDTGERIIWGLNSQLGIVSSLSLPQFYVGWRFAGVGRYTTDNLPNIVLQNSLTGERVLWSINTSGVITGSTALPTLPVAWSFAGPALNRAKPTALSDFNRDGQSDILLTNTTTGERVIWAMNGNAIGGSLGLPTLPTVWRFAGNADFNGDGMNDLLLENATTGDRIIWLMNGSTIGGSVALPTLPVAWSFAAVSDVNLDGEPDIVLQNQNTGDHLLWLLDRTTIVGSKALPPLPVSWQIAAAGNFTADGRANLLLENTTTGVRLFWAFNADWSVESVGLPTFLGGWRFVGTGDFFGSARPHIILENRSTGDHVIWRMSNTDISSSASLPTLPVSWTVRN
jgi:PKD repeat protein